MHLPKQTFFNLSQEKREKIEQAALNEFAEYGYDNSNMNRIVASSQIAKGSFYQYFDDKKDVYLYLMDSLANRKIELFRSLICAIEQNSLLHNLREMFRIGLEFANSDPKFFKLSQNSVYKNPELLQEFNEKYNPVALDIFGKMLENARKKGELRVDVNIPLISSFISALVSKATLDLIAGAAQKETREAVVEELIRFIECAVIKNNNGGRQSGSNKS